MRPVTLNDYKQRLLRVLDHIHAHLDDPLPVATLARVASLSPYHFHRVFTGMVGETVNALVRRLRLERAAWQLQHQSQGILGIALDAGYDSHEAFTRAFARAFHRSPSAYRRITDADPRLHARSGVHFNPYGPLARFRTTPFRALAMKIEISSLPARRVACLRHVGPYNACGPTWERLGEILGAAGEFGPGALMIGISYDDPENTPPDQVRFDAGVTVDEHFVPHDGLEIRQLPAGDYAVGVWQGPYSGLGRAYRHLMGEWLPRSGRELAESPCYESYLNDPDNTDPSDLITEIHLPLKA